MSASPAGVNTQIALLCAVNVGSRNRVNMASLREAMDASGYEATRTYLQSGNIVFRGGQSTKRAAGGIEDLLARELGLQVRVLVRTRDQLAGVLARNPFADVADDPARLLVGFLCAAPDPEAVKRLDSAGFLPDLFRFDAEHVYMWCPQGVQKTKLTSAFFQKRLGVTMTARNWNTVAKLLELADR